MKSEEIETSWEVFDICDTCGVGAKQRCCNLLLSTPKRLVYTTRPHSGRKMLPKNAR